MRVRFVTLEDGGAPAFIVQVVRAFQGPHDEFAGRILAACRRNAPCQALVELARTLRHSANGDEASASIVVDQLAHAVAKATEDGFVIRVPQHQEWPDGERVFHSFAIRCHTARSLASEGSGAVPLPLADPANPWGPDQRCDY